AVLPPSGRRVVGEQSSEGSMHRLRLAVGALALVAALVFAAVAQAHGPQPGALELPGKRTATSTTYLNHDGSFTTVVAPRAVNYRDASGAWQPIDTTLVSSSASGYAFQNAAGPFRALFKDGAGAGFVRFDGACQSFALGLQNAAHGSAHARNSSIEYQGALPSTELGYRVLSTGIKETLTLADAHG